MVKMEAKAYAMRNVGSLSNLVEKALREYMRNHPTQAEKVHSTDRQSL
jgi:hypothetical protein